jgi:hypothetical protein
MKCCFEFETVNLLNADYGPLFFMSENYEIGIYDPDLDNSWGYISDTFEELSKKYKFDDFRKDIKFEVLMNELVNDSTSVTNKYYIWSKIPCPNCKSFDRSYFGPFNPPKIVEKELRPLNLQLKEKNQIEEILVKTN